MVGLDSATARSPPPAGAAMGPCPRAARSEEWTHHDSLATLRAKPSPQSMVDENRHQRPTPTVRLVRKGYGFLTFGPSTLAPRCQTQLSGDAGAGERLAEALAIQAALRDQEARTLTAERKPSRRETTHRHRAKGIRAPAPGALLWEPFVQGRLGPNLLGAVGPNVGPGPKALPRRAPIAPSRSSSFGTVRGGRRNGCRAWRIPAARQDTTSQAPSSPAELSEAVETPSLTRPQGGRLVPRQRRLERAASQRPLAAARWPRTRELQLAHPAEQMPLGEEMSRQTCGPGRGRTRIVSRQLVVGLPGNNFRLDHGRPSVRLPGQSGRESWARPSMGASG